MPYYWQLKDKDVKVVDPIVLDERICKHLEIKPDPVKYVEDWWDMVGFALIEGRTTREVFEEAKTSFFATPRDQRIWAILSEYHGEAWYQSRSR